MEESKVNIKSFLKTLFRSFNNPVLAIDSKGEILESNQQASTIFKINELGKNLSSVLLPDSFAKLEGYIQNISGKNSFFVAEDFHFQLKDSTEIISNMVLNFVDYEEDSLILLSLADQNAKDTFFSFTKIDIRTGNPLEAIFNPGLKKIIREIRNLYPLTVTGKDRLRKIIDEFDELVRIKNEHGKLVLVNLAYAQSLGIAVTQLEGKSENDFLPPFVMDLLTSIDKYLYETHNHIIVEGLPLKGISNVSEQQIVEIPITDYQNNVIAVLGITQSKLREKEKEISAELYFSGEIIDAFPKPVAFINQYGEFQHASTEFCKLVSEDSVFINGKHVTEVLLSELAEEIKAFQGGSISSRVISVSENLLPVPLEESFYKVYLNKISVSDISSAGVFIFIEEEKNKTELEQLLTQRGNMFDILIQNNPEPIFIYDKENLRFLEVNESALVLYGYSRDEFVQMDLTDLYTPEDIQTLLGSSSDDSLAGIFTGPYRHKKRNGESVFVEISKTKFQYNGKDSYLNIIRDVTQRLELEKKSQQFKAAFKNTNDAIFITDSTGFISFINTPGSELLGYSANELQKTSFTALVRDDDRSMINTSVFIAETSEPVNLLLDIKKKDGSFQASEVIFTPILDFNSKVDSFTIVLKPVKEESTEQVKEVVKEVIIERESKETHGPDPNFLSGVFHEILTPMNVILGFAQELTDSIAHPTPEQKEASNLINQNKLKLLGTMNSVVEYSELLQNKFELNVSDVSITQIIDSIDKKMSELVNSPEMQLAYGKISSSLTFKSDAHKFETLVASLIKVISRLVKEKKVYFSAFPISDENFIVLVSDVYNNCSDYLISRLQLIYQGDNDIKDLGTPKLTTHLSKMLLPMLGGSLSVDEKYGAGFIFPISLSQVTPTRKYESIDESIEELIHKDEPVAFDPFASKQEVMEEKLESEIQKDFAEDSFIQPEPVEEFKIEESAPIIDDLLQSDAEPEIMDQSAADTFIKDTVSEANIPKDETRIETPKKQAGKLDISKLTCLYIEDQVDSQILFKVQMKGLQEVKFAVSFEEALPMLEERTFDFIVMDINLQGEYNGLDALKIINKMPAHENTPVIAVTAYVLPGDKEKFIATGFNDFVSKPIFREKMIESLERIFSK